MGYTESCPRFIRFYHILNPSLPCLNSFFRLYVNLPLQCQNVCHRVAASLVRMMEAGLLWSCEKRGMVGGKYRWVLFQDQRDGRVLFEFSIKEPTHRFPVPSLGMPESGIE